MVAITWPKAWLPSTTVIDHMSTVLGVVAGEDVGGKNGEVVHFHADVAGFKNTELLGPLAVGFVGVAVDPLVGFVRVGVGVLVIRHSRIL